MEKVRNLKDLLIEQIRDLYSGEKQQANALADWSQKATARELRLALQNHLDETKSQIDRLEGIFDRLNVSPYGEICEPQGLMIREGAKLAERSADPEVLDAGLITSLQHIEHYEIAGYGAACTYADTLGYEDVKEQLHDILEEEKAIDRHLSILALESINQKAKTPITMH